MSVFLGVIYQSSKNWRLCRVHTLISLSCGDLRDTSVWTKPGPNCELKKPGSNLYNWPRPGVKFYLPLDPTVQDKSPLNMFLLSQSCHVPHSPNDIYELIDGTMARLSFVFMCGCLISKDPPCTSSNVISGGQDQMKYCIHTQEKINLKKSLLPGLIEKERTATWLGSVTRISLCCYHECKFLNT